VSIWNTGRRMEGTQRTTGVSGGSGPLFFVLHIIPIVSLFAPVYMQTELNKSWRAIRALETMQSPELSTAPDEDLGPLTAETSREWASSSAVSESSDEVDDPEPGQGRQPPEDTP
jgi:hypothetical protein